MNQNPIFLLGSHRSGAGLLRHFLDGHSQIFCVPIETHFFRLMHYWVDYQFQSEQPKSLPLDQLLDRFNFWISHCNQSKDTYTDSEAFGLFKEDKFQLKLIDLFDVKNPKKSFEAYIQAIYYSIMGNVLSDGLRILEKSAEHAEFAHDLKGFYPQAKFIHVIRNPYATLVSLRKFKSVEGIYPQLTKILQTLHNHYYFLYQNKRTISDYLIVRYEDLVSQPQRQLDDICDFLEIPFESPLLSPTRLGKKWKGNSMNGERFESIESSHLDSWKSQIAPIEIAYINHLFPFVLEDYQYDTLQIPKGFWKPQKGEYFSRYLQNRFLQYFF